MLSDPDFYLFSIKINARKHLLLYGKSHSMFLKLNSVNSLLNYGYFPEVPRVQHISTVCPETAAFRVVWWDTVIENFDITLSAKLSSLCPRDIYVYLFLLGSRFISNVTDNFDIRTLHFLNFRFLGDTAAWYNLYLCSIQNTT